MMIRHTKITVWDAGTGTHVPARLLDFTESAGEILAVVAHPDTGGLATYKLESVLYALPEMPPTLDATPDPSPPAVEKVPLVTGTGATPLVRIAAAGITAS